MKGREAFCKLEDQESTRDAGQAAPPTAGRNLLHATADGHWELVLVRIKRTSLWREENLDLDVDSKARCAWY